MTKKELLRWIDLWEKEAMDDEIAWRPGEYEAHQEIRRLIEQGPKVTREFVEKWADKILSYLPVGQFHLYRPKLVELLYALVKEAGVGVKSVATAADTRVLGS